MQAKWVGDLVAEEIDQRIAGLFPTKNCQICSVIHFDQTTYSADFEFSGHGLAGGGESSFERHPHRYALRDGRRQIKGDRIAVYQSKVGADIIRKKPLIENAS